MKPKSFNFKLCSSSSRQLQPPQTHFLPTPALIKVLKGFLKIFKHLKKSAVLWLPMLPSPSAGKNFVCGALFFGGGVGTRQKTCIYGPKTRVYFPWNFSFLKFIFLILWSCCQHELLNKFPRNTYRWVVRHSDYSKLIPIGLKNYHTIMTYHFAVETFQVRVFPNNFRNTGFSVGNPMLAIRSCSV